MTAPTTMRRIVLEPERRNTEVDTFEMKLRSRIVGQDEAVSQLVNIYETVRAGMAIPGRPIANLLFLGPTGSGKTHIIEAAAEILFGSPKALLKIDCAEFQHSHEIAKLIGSPPGYIGHRETHAILTQDAINQFQTESLDVTFVLFDEIEKSSDALWRLLLGVLDTGTLTLGDNQKVDLSRTIIVMTSNLGAEEMSRVANGSGIGFASGANELSTQHSQKRLHNAALASARRYFSPEFMNRLDKIVVFQALSPVQLREILEIELAEVHFRIRSLHPELAFKFACTPETKAFLIQQGTDAKYGARPLKRAIERFLVLPMARLLSTSQILAGDSVTVDLVSGKPELLFLKDTSDAMLPPAEQQESHDELWECFAAAYAAHQN